MNAPRATPDKPDASTSCKKELTTWLLSFSILGDAIGAGVYALVGEAGADTGGAVRAPLPVALCLALMTVTSYAELATKSRCAPPPRPRPPRVLTRREAPVARRQDRSAASRALPRLLARLPHHCGLRRVPQRLARSSASPARSAFSCRCTHLPSVKCFVMPASVSASHGTA